MYVVENLKVRSWFRVVLPCLLRRRPATSPTCWVIDASPWAFAVARTTGSLVGVTLERLVFRLIDIRDETGLLARLQVAYNDMRRVQAEILKDPLIQEFILRCRPIHRLLMYVAKSTSLATFNLRRQTLWRALFVVQVCVWKRKQAGAQVPESVLFLERRTWPKQIIDYAARHGFDVIWLPPTVEVASRLRQSLPPTVFHGLRWVYYRWLVRRPRASVDREVASTTRHVAAAAREVALPGAPVAVEYYGHLNLDEPHLNSDLFFWQQSALPARDVIVHFGVPRDPLDMAKCAELRRHGIGAVVTHPAACSIPGFPVFQPRRSNTGARVAAPMLSGHEGRWLKDRILEYERLKDYWGELFERTAARVFVSWYHVDATNSAIADALEGLGGVTALYQRSSDVLPAPTITNAADVYFSFSKMAVQVQQRSGSSIRYHVVTGFLGDHRFESLRQRAQPLRQRLMACGATRILALFDENAGDDSRWHTGHELQRAYYEFLLEKLLANEWLGLVVKPKVPLTLRRRLGPVAELLARAEATGRCHVFEGGALHGSHPPAAAALAADVAIHGHLCAGSAGVEAALTGVPTLLVDREGWHISPLYRLGVGQVVFTSWDDLWRALLEGWNTVGRPGGLGDWSGMLDEFDPFRDGRAAERMGTYIHWLVEGLKTGLSRETVMADAAERYCRRWGRDMVTTITGFPMSRVRASGDAANGGPLVASTPAS